jgi:hypothetical protein
MRPDPHTSALAVVLVFVAFLGGCTKAQFLDASARTLEAVQTTTDVAWTYAVEEDIQEQQGVIDELRAIRTAGGELPPRETAEARLEAVRARWAPRMAAFRVVREAHALALQAWQTYKDGQVGEETFTAALDHLLELFRAMQDLLGDVPVPDLEPQVNP